MALTIHVLDYGDIELETSFLVLGHECGRVRPRPRLWFFDPRRNLSGSGRYRYRDNAIMESLGMRGLQFHDNMIREPAGQA